MQRHQVMRTSETTSMHSQVRGSVERRNSLPCAVMIVHAAEVRREMGNTIFGKTKVCKTTF